ncbi:hypothetical protein PTKIN_Ptkin04bG0001900 [Pterospermum kingtungense]
MDPNPKSYPLLSYVMSRLPSFGPSSSSTPHSHPSVDLEQPPPPPHDPSAPSSSTHLPHIVHQMPHLSHPSVLASMTHAVSDVAQTRSLLQTLGPRPDHESVDVARSKLAEIESNLSKSLEELVLSPRPVEVDRLEWRTHLADKEQQIRQQAEKEKAVYKTILQLDEMHEAYGKLLKEAEERLVKIYEKAGKVADNSEEVEPQEVNVEVVGILEEAQGSGLERVDLSARKLRFLPEAFGKISALLVLNLSSNLLEVIPDSIAGLEKLEELNLSSNLLESLPDSIGLLQNLKILDVSRNKLNALPDTICHCRSLIELDASFNSLSYLPTNLGNELGNLQRLSIHLNKIRSLPTSICQMISLRFLDAHFNELCGLPDEIGRLTNLEVLNLSSNFTDLRELPDTLGELTNLKELDLSNNQIYALPDTFGRLDKLTKLNLEQNPLVIPPPEVVKLGVGAVKTFMAKRWLDILVEEERKSMLEVNERAEDGDVVTLVDDDDLADVMRQQLKFLRIDVQLKKDKLALPHILRNRVLKSARPKLDSSFSMDVNVPDGTVMAPSTPFTKIWRMRNNGTMPWSRGMQLVWTGGNKLSNVVSVDIEIPADGVPVDGELDIAVDFTAPQLPGRYISYWRMASQSGIKFGQRIWVLIHVYDSMMFGDDRQGLNLNLPPESSGPRDSQIVDMNVDLITELCNSNAGTEPVKPMVNEQSRKEQTVNSSDVPKPSPSSSSVAYPIVDQGVLVPVLQLPTLSSSAAHPIIDQGVPVHTSSQIPSSSVSYPIIDLSEASPGLSEVPPPVVSVQAPLPAISVRAPPQEDSENAVEQTLLKELEDMGFKQVDLNKEILRRNEYDLEKSVEDLCGVAEWDPILEELQEMGFCDAAMNKKLLKKNNGSIKGVVMDLLTGDRA